MSHKTLRNLEILKIRQRGIRFTEISKLYGLTVEGIRQIVKSEGAKEGFGPYGHLLSSRARKALEGHCKKKGRRIPRNLKELRGLLDGNWQSEMTSRQGIGPKTIEELDFMLGQDIQLDEPDTSQRNHRIFELRESGKTFKQISDMFGISIQRVRGIHRRESDNREKEESLTAVSGPLVKLSGNAYRAVCSAVNRARLDVEEPNWRSRDKFWPGELRKPVSFRQFMEWVEWTSEWRYELLAENRCGKATLREIENFVKDNGIGI